LTRGEVQLILTYLDIENAIQNLNQPIEGNGKGGGSENAVD
jgi:hypothetical protein